MSDANDAMAEARRVLTDALKDKQEALKVLRREKSDLQARVNAATDAVNYTERAIASLNKAITALDGKP